MLRWRCEREVGWMGRLIPDMSPSNEGDIMQTKENDLVMIALFAALVAVLGLLPAIPMPWGIPVTAQSLGVMLAGAVLGAKRGGLSMLLFIGLVALGLPLLAGGRGGLGVFVSPTAGFVVGFPVAAYVTGLVMQNLRVDAMIASGIASLIGGIVVLYVMGIGGFWMLTDKGLMASITIMATYIPGDLVKVVLTAIVVGALVKARPQSLLSRQ